MLLKPIKTSLPFLLGFCFLATEAIGQQVKIDVDKPNFEDLESPEFGGNTNEKRWEPKDWLEVEVKLKVEARPEPKDGFVDNVSIRWYVAVENPEQKGSYYRLQKDVRYVNVPLKEDMYASVYISPATIRRLTGGERAGKSAVWGVAGEVSHNGSVVATFSSKTTKEWWKSGSLSSTDKFPLLSKNETPFKALWYDRFLQEEEGRR